MALPTLETLRRAVPPVRSEGYPVIALAAGLTGLAALLLPSFWAAIGLVLTIAIAAFFRDPPRVVPQRPDLVLAAADGIVCAVEAGTPPPETGLTGTWTRIATYMSAFEVHVNRAPVAGRVLRVVHRPGQFLAADRPEVGERNERCSYVLAADGVTVVVVQIAGLVARRIVAFAGAGAPLEAGERLGMIRFGSRVDVYLPAPLVPDIAVGQRMIAGETVLARTGPAAPPTRYRTL